MLRSAWADVRRTWWARSAWSPPPSAPPARPSLLTALLRSARARYLLTVRRGSLPHDPVARFHLRNGARVEQINWLADTSAKGMAESHGLLVNYLYSGQDIAANNEALTLDGLVTASREVAALLDPFDESLVRMPANRAPCRGDRVGL